MDIDRENSLKKERGNESKSYFMDIEKLLKILIKTEEWNNHVPYLVTTHFPN